MKSTATAKAKRGKARTTTATSSFATEATSKTPVDPLELGRLLVDAVTGEGSEDTLTTWMMHYIAELIAKAEKESTSTIVNATKKEACDTILKLWEHRATLSGRANPMKEYEAALRMLQKLSSEGYFFVRGLRTEDDPIDEFRQSSASLLGSLLVFTLPENIDSSSVTARSLSKQERKFLKELHVIRIRRMVSIDDARADEDPRDALKRDIHEDIARMRRSLDRIEASLISE